MTIASLPGIGGRGVTITLDGTLDDATIFDMVEDSFDLVLGGLLALQADRLRREAAAARSASSQT